MLETLTSSAPPREMGPRVPAMRRLAVSACAAVQFLTILPPLVRRPLSADEVGGAVGFFPLVGALLGAMLIGIDRLTLLVWPVAIATALVLAGWVLLTGALHLDGFLDWCDGVFGGQTPEARLRVLRDERVGAYAVVGGILLLLIKYQAMLSLTNRVAALLLAPVFGRWAMTLAIVLFPYARAQGLGRDMKDRAGWRALGLASVCTGMVLCWYPRGLALLAFVGVLFTTLGIGLFSTRRLQGLTGDVYGAIGEMGEVVVLLALAAGGAA